MDKDLYTQKIAFFSDELEKIDRFFSDFTSRQAVLITGAGLLSFLPPLGITGPEYLPHFLLWTFPFLVGVFIAYYPSSLRIQPIIKQTPFAFTGSTAELEVLKTRTLYLEIIWNKSTAHYEKVLRWSRITSSLAYAYIFSVSSNFYVFIFIGEPSLCISVVLFLITCLIAGGLCFWPLLKSEKNKKIEA